MLDKESYTLGKASYGYKNVLYINDVASCRICHVRGSEHIGSYIANYISVRNLSSYCYNIYGRNTNNS